MIKKYDKILKVCYIILGFCVVAIIVLIGAMKIQKSKKLSQQRTNYLNELTQAWQDDNYITTIYVGEASVQVYVNDSFLNLSNSEMLDLAAEYVNFATASRTSYDMLNDGSYVTMHFYNESGVEIVKTNSKGQIKIVKDEFQ